MNRCQFRRSTKIRSWRTDAVLYLTFVLSTGCGYTTHGLYPADIHTVAVPVVQTDNLFRREVELLLTEKLVRGIESRTPLKVVPVEEADTELRTTITAFYKTPYGEDGFDNPRGGNMVLTVAVTWIDKRTNEVLGDAGPNSPRQFYFQANEPFTIDTAQSITSATASTLDQIVDRIIGVMQVPW